MSVKNTFLYAGVSKTLYNRLKPRIIESNRQSMCIYTLLGFLLMFGMLIASQFEPSLAKMRSAYVLVGTLCFILFFIVRFVKNSVLTQAAMYLFMGSVLLFGIAQGTWIDPTSLSLAYTVLLFVVPMVFCDIPARLILISVLSMAVYFVAASKTQTAEMFSYNTTNVIPFGILSLILCPYINNLKIDHAYLTLNSQGKSQKISGAKTEYDTRVKTMVSLVESMMNYHSEESLVHYKRVMQYSRLLCHAYNQLHPDSQFTEDQIDRISLGAELHDIGKIYVQDSILKKTTPFTEEERRIVQQHPAVGASLIEYICRICNIEPTLMYNVVRSHHERWDGSGYPDHLKGSDIPIEAQLVAIAEVYDALTAENYSRLYSHEEAYDMIAFGECGEFSPIALECFKHVKTDFMIIHADQKQERWDLLDKVYTVHGSAYWRIKRFFDVALSSMALLFFSPILLAVALWIKLDDPSSPVIFKQERLGRHKKPFKMYKFRTMVPNAEQLLKELQTENEKDGPVFKIKKDPRITKPGHFLRKSSLDELPQLINIIKGDMTIVGPRPPLASEVEKYSRYHEIRLSVTPGLTCLWQAHESRDDVPFEDWMDMDVAYIGARSTLTDIKIIFKTFISVIKGSGH